MFILNKWRHLCTEQEIEATQWRHLGSVVRSARYRPLVSSATYIQTQNLDNAGFGSFTWSPPISYLAEANAGFVKTIYATNSCQKLILDLANVASNWNTDATLVEFLLTMKATMHLTLCWARETLSNMFLLLQHWLTKVCGYIGIFRIAFLYLCRSAKETPPISILNKWRHLCIEHDIEATQWRHLCRQQGGIRW